MGLLHTSGLIIPRQTEFCSLKDTLPFVSEGSHSMMKIFSHALRAFAVLSIALVVCYARVRPKLNISPKFGPGNLFTEPSPTASTLNAECILGTIPVSVNATNIKLLISSTQDQANVTEILQELLQSNSDIGPHANAGPLAVNATFSISATICLPRRGRVDKRVVQILSHGLGLDKDYWNIAPGNSYVDAAAKLWYSTLRYDGLGVGNSEEPDPVNTVQFMTHVEILHGLAQRLRGLTIASRTLRKVVGTGHSVGSITQIGATAKYLADFDAVVITGCSDTLQFLPNGALSTTPALVNTENP